MAIHSVGLLLLMMLSSSILALVVVVRGNDEAALLAFKAAAISGGYGDPLASWNSTTDGYCSWEGVRCRGRHHRVVSLSLSSRGLTGVLSPAIGNLSSLRYLNLSFNAFSGDIPASLGRLSRLRLLDLSRNTLSGKFPINLTSCINLNTIFLRYNQLHGVVPSEIGDKLKGLEVLSLDNNSFTGTIPPSLGNLSSLYYLELALNQLEGTIPSSLGDLRPSMKYLDLAFNSLSGEPPLSLYNLSALLWLQLQGNMLQGGIPADIGDRLPSLLIIGFFSNRFTGPIPASLSNLTALHTLDLSNNSLSGYVPRNLGRQRALVYLNLGYNSLEADNREGWEFITSLSNCSQLYTLALSGNAAFKGQLTSSITNLSTNLETLAFDDTGISGSIPSGIDNLISLQILVGARTSISGLIPESIGKLGNLTELLLFNTELSGQIPSSIGNLSNLIQLDAHHANLEGPIPASMGNMKNLNILDLSQNRLNGSIPKEIFNLPFLSIYLNLSYNSLSGSVPSEVGNLDNLNKLALSGNQLSGEIPETIGRCTVLQELWLDNNSFAGNIPQSLNNITGLTAVDLSRNNLSGYIPDGIGTIRNLQLLYLSHNNLSGSIPIGLQNLASLSELDLSFNNLHGEVPIFRNLTYFSITGNNDLCGGMPQLHLAPCHIKSVERKRKRHSKSLTIALASTGVLFLLASVIALIQFIQNKFRQKHKSSFLPPIVEEQYERVSYQSLANGTNRFSEANLIGRGSFGAVYKCTFQEDGTTAAVKVFNLEHSSSTRSFVAECEVLRRVRHRCLIKIITCCSSINHQGQDFKALVFEFMPNGSLSDWLHPKSGMPTLGDTLSLEQRLDIAVDIIDALDYLHNHCQPPIVHCDLKPSNILLAKDMSARVGDFGISRILPESASKALLNSNSTIGIRGSVGYIAPEYGEGAIVSNRGDVYSFGILLLEIFTGRSPTDAMFQGQLDLHKFSCTGLPDRIWEIADTNLWPHTDAYDSSTKSTTENCLLSVISLGISCSKKQPRERTLIHDAAIEMHSIRDSYLLVCQTSLKDHGVETTKSLK